MYIQPEDVPVPQYIVVAIHSGFEQTIKFFINEKAAMDAYEIFITQGTEAYITKIVRHG
jgi:hypothetical protein